MRHTCIDCRNTLPPIRAAIRTTQNEQAELESEKDALADFIKRLNEIPAVQPDAATPSHLRASGPDALPAVRAAFQDTLMSVSHYDIRYDEPLFEHLQKEFTPEIAAAVHPQTAPEFTPVIKENLLSCAHTRAHKRDSLIKAIEYERSSLQTAQSQVEHFIDELDRTGIPICVCSDLAQTLEQIAQIRQKSSKNAHQSRWLQSVNFVLICMGNVAGITPYYRF